jgi:hypothetical protein
MYFAQQYKCINVQDTYRGRNSTQTYELEMIKYTPRNSKVHRSYKEGIAKAACCFPLAWRHLRSGTKQKQKQHSHLDIALRLRGHKYANFYPRERRI